MTQHYSKADLHMHSTYSDGLMTPEALVEYVAANTDLSVIAVTDHDTMEGSRVARAYAQHFADEFGGLEVLLGSEITSADCDIVALFIEEDIPKGLSAAETVERIHAQGGLAIAVHPYSFVLELLGDDGMRGAREHIRDVPFDAVEVVNGTPTELFMNPLTRYNNRRWANRPETAGSDAHYIRSLGCAYTLFPGSTAADLRHAIENAEIIPQGSIYNPLLALNLAWDGLTRRIPVHTLPPTRAAEWEHVRETVLGNATQPEDRTPDRVVVG